MVAPQNTGVFFLRFSCQKKPVYRGIGNSHFRFVGLPFDA